MFIETLGGSRFSLNGNYAKLNQETVHLRIIFKNKKTKRNMEIVHERTILSNRHLSAKLVPIIADRGCYIVSTTYPYGHILDFLNQSRYFFS
jgi:hypothetical protein